MNIEEYFKNKRIERIFRKKYISTLINTINDLEDEINTKNKEIEKLKMKLNQKN